MKASLFMIIGNAMMFLAGIILGIVFSMRLWDNVWFPLLNIGLVGAGTLFEYYAIQKFKGG